MRNSIKLLAFLLFGIFLIVSVHAQQQSLGGAVIGQCISVIQSYGNSSWMNITAVVLPDKLTIIQINKTMQNLGQGFFNYTFCNVTQSGEHIFNGISDVDGLPQTWTYNAFASPVGLQQTVPQAIGSSIYLVLMIILMFVFGILGFRMFKTNTWWVMGIFFMFFASLLLVYNTYLGYEYQHLFTGLPNSPVPETIFWMFLMIVVLGLLVTAALLFLNWKKVIRYIKREIKRKDEDDSDLEDWDVDSWSGEKWQVKNRR